MGLDGGIRRAIHGKDTLCQVQDFTRDETKSKVLESGHRETLNRAEGGR